MKSPRQLIKYLSERRLAKSSLNQEGRNYYRKHAKQLKQDLRTCPKFFLGKLDDWDIDPKELELPEELEIRLPYDSMLVEFSLTDDYPGGVLFRQGADGITGECYIGVVKTMFIHTFKGGAAKEDYQHIARLAKSKVKEISPAELDALSAGDNDKYEEALDNRIETVERESIGVALILASLIALLCMNEGALSEDDGTMREGRMDASRDEPDVIYKTLTLDLDRAKRIIASRGGTHASPRHHTRRGHWRHMESGKKVWIGPMEIGDKADGEVVKDYKVKSTGLWDRFVAKMNQYTAFAKG